MLRIMIGMKFSRYFKGLREERALTKSELARALGITVQYLVDIEAGRIKPPTIARCEQLCRALKLTDPEKKEMMRLAIQERLPKPSLSYYEKIIRSAPPVLTVRDSRQAGYSGTVRTAVVRVPVRKDPSGKRNKRGVSVRQPFMELPEAAVKGRSLFVWRAEEDAAEAAVQKGDLVLAEEKARPRSGERVIVDSGEGPRVRLFPFSEKKPSTVVCGVVRAVFQKDFLHLKSS